MKLELEIKDQKDKTTEMVGEGNILLVVTPPIGEEYWKFRVRVSDDQAIIGFPKFATIGIGFQVEKEDWNTNLPFTGSAETILKHIWANRGAGNDGPEFRARCLEAIRMIQKAAKEIK